MTHVRALLDDVQGAYFILRYNECGTPLALLNQLANQPRACLPASVTLPTHAPTNGSSPLPDGVVSIERARGTKGERKRRAYLLATNKIPLRLQDSLRLFFHFISVGTNVERKYLLD